MWARDKKMKDTIVELCHGIRVRVYSIVEKTIELSA